MQKINNALRVGLGMGIMLFGMLVFTVGALIVRLGVWIRPDVDMSEDLTDEELAQILKEYKESQGDKE